QKFHTDGSLSRYKARLVVNGCSQQQASSASLLQCITSLLHSEFAMTDIGCLNYFLGIYDQRSTSGMFMSRSKFAEEILVRAHMQNCNSSDPVDTNSKLGSDGDPLSDPTLYRNLVGAL
ncbi:ribonuclease H-like domain-containing protein, partial [Tanacetum coccineum]